MLDVIPEPRHTTRSTAPRIVSIQVPTDKIRDVIGSGGKVIRGIQDETGASVDIQEDGTVFVGGTGESVDQAVERIKLIIKVPEPGEEYTGRVVSIQLRRLRQPAARQGRPAAHLPRRQGPRGEGRGCP